MLLSKILHCTYITDVLSFILYTHVGCSPLSSFVVSYPDLQPRVTLRQDRGFYTLYNTILVICPIPSMGNAIALQQTFPSSNGLPLGPGKCIIALPECHRLTGQLHVAILMHASGVRQLPNLGGGPVVLPVPVTRVTPAAVDI